MMSRAKICASFLRKILTQVLERTSAEIAECSRVQFSARNL